MIFALTTPCLDKQNSERVKIGIFSYPSVKTCVLGAQKNRLIQKNRLNETVLFSGCTTFRQKTFCGIQQLVYKDNCSTMTVCQMRHLVYSFFTYDIWSKKI